MIAMLLWAALSTGAFASTAEKDCIAEESLRSILPAKREECRHLNAVVAEFKERFSDISKHCQLMRKVAIRHEAISRKRRNELVLKVKELLEPPSFGNVVITSMPDSCLEDREKMYQYRRKAIEAFQPLIRTLTHLSNDRDPLRQESLGDEFKK